MARPEPTLQEQWGPIFRDKWLIILITVIAIAVSLGVSLTQPERYTAEVRVLIEGNEEELSLQAESQRVASVAVAQRVIDELGLGTSAPDLVERIDAQPLDDEGTAISIAYTSADANESASVANALADAYFAERAEVANQQAAAATERVEELIAEVEADLAEAADSGDDAAAARAAALSARIGALQERLADIELQAAIEARGGQVQVPAEVPGSSRVRDLIQNVVLALILGLSVGIALAYLRSRMAPPASVAARRPPPPPPA
jgi:uncharacterized protein involved in exopolysaccharide biosynthesis